MKFAGVRLLSVVAAFAAAMLIPYLVGGLWGDFGARMAVLAGLYITLSVSLNLINGITGQFSIGHAAFYQVGAYAAGYCTKLFYDRQPLAPSMWLVLMVVIGAIAAGMAGFVVGLPSLRLRGDYLAIVTMGFGEIIRIVTQNIEAIGGSYGMPITPKIPSPLMVWLLAILCIAVCRNLQNSAHGLPFLAVREDETAAAATGVDVTRVKVTAFIIGSAFAGAAGALLAHYEGFISPQTFPMDMSFIILTMVVLGGTGSVTGATIAAVVLFAIPEYMRTVQDAKGNPLQVSAASIVAAVFAVAIAVALIRRVLHGYHGDNLRKTGLYLGSVVVAMIAHAVLRAGFALSPYMAKTMYDVVAIRMPILAGTLIVLMLIRPQGMLARNEFSWDWFVGLFRRKTASGGEA